MELEPLTTMRIIPYRFYYSFGGVPEPEMQVYNQALVEMQDKTFKHLRSQPHIIITSLQDSSLSLVSISENVVEK